MYFVITAVLLVGALCALNLVLTLGVIKRLREHTDLLAAGSNAPTIGIGQEVGEFSARTVDGETVSPDLLSGETVVAFLLPELPALPGETAGVRGVCADRARRP